MSLFNGKNPNGTWSLYVMDDHFMDVGSIDGGWSLSITTSSPVDGTPATMQSIGMTANGKYRVAVRGQPGLRYSVHTSTDLRNYSTIHSFTMPNGGVYFYDDNISDACKFYRASKNP